MQRSTEQFFRGNGQYKQTQPQIHQTCRGIDISRFVRRSLIHNLSQRARLGVFQVRGDGFIRNTCVHVLLRGSISVRLDFVLIIKLDSSEAVLPRAQFHEITLNEEIYTFKYLFVCYNSCLLAQQFRL